MSKVTVVIPNYNGRHFLYPCMSALCGQIYTDFDVLIVDNGSSDGSQEMIRALECGRLEREKQVSGAETKQLPLPFSVRGIFLSENTGFSGAVNAGIYAAEGEYIILLNNDTEAEPGYIAALAAELDRDKRKHVFAVSPKMVQLYQKHLIDDAGDGYTLLGWAFQRGVGQPVSEKKFCRVRSVFSACAGAAIYRKEILEKIAISGDKQKKENQAVPEYFDLQHFAYLEDIDLCYRARIYGYQVRYCPEAVVYHVGSGTSGSKYNAFKVRLAARNNVYLNYKNMPALQLFLNLPGILAGIFVKQLFFAKIGFGREYAGGFLEGIRTMGNCRKVHFQWGHLPNYIKIELRLLSDTFSYIDDFLRRRAKRRKGKNPCIEGQKDRNERCSAEENEKYEK